MLPKPQPESGQTAESDRRISMSEDDFRWTLMWHGDFIRELTLLEVERDGLRRARQHTEKHDDRRRAFLRSIEDGRPARRTRAGVTEG